MIKSSVVQARLDPTLKNEVEAILKEIGLSTTQALTFFFQQIRLTKGIPFDINAPEENIEHAVAQSNPRPFTPFPVDPNRSLMERNVQAYKAMHGELVQHYLGQYVALCDGQLIDRDTDPVALLLRVRAGYLDQVVLRRKVESVPERELHIRHPRIEKFL